MKAKLKDKEKEQGEKLKALRRELEEQLEEQLGGSPIKSFGDDRVVIPAKAGISGRGNDSYSVHINEEELKDPARAKRVLESLLFASSKPLTVQDIRKALKVLSAGEIAQIIGRLKQEYAAEGRSFEILEIAGGFEVATKREFAPWVMKIELQRRAKQATQSALETLAILAYKQPVTRAEIEALRGVDVSAVLTTLMERSLIKIVGKKDVPGRPFLYGTTEKFLEHFGLNSLEGLPDIQEIKNLVDNSVRKEELLGTTNIVEVPPETPQAPPTTEETKQNESESASQKD